MTNEPLSIGECIFEGAHSRIFRARRVADDRPVIVKQLRALYPSPEAIAGLRREYEITKAAAADGVIEAIELTTDDRSIGIVLEDFGASALAGLVPDPDGTRTAVLDPRVVVRIGIQVSRALDAIHRRNIVHKDISPGNIVWNEQTGVAKLIDFGMSQVLQRETVGTRAAATFEGTPAYCSPEQTGRMNRAVDARSDFYSLGATLYALLTGAPPFVADDRLALVHAHLAKTPVAPHVVNPAVPVALSDVIMLLLQKRAEDRYQSAVGLTADLERCLDVLERGRPTETFELRTGDVDEGFHIPERLYGRGEQVEALLDTFDRAAGGRGRLFLVGGEPGIGKTSLVHEVHRVLAGRSARFVEGKFDQFNRGTPYFAFIQALGDLVRIVLAENSDAIAAWRGRVVDAVGSNGQVLIDVLPEIQHVIGPQPAMDELPASEAKNRFQLTIASFVRAVATAEHPMVVFLDDLQWADVPSIDLIAMLAGDPDSRHLMLIGAYRDNEVDATHALTVALEHMRSAGAAVESIRLGPLDDEDVLELVTDTVGDAPGRVRLALLCHAKTAGNAFFLKRFLTGLHEQGLLRFDPAGGRWTWDLNVIQAQAITENVVEFLATEIARLGPRSQRALQAAACVGDAFDLKTVAFAAGSTRKAISDDLRDVLAAELVLPATEGFWFTDHVDEDSTNFSYRFVHDRIRQAAHASLASEDAAAIHLRLGRALLDGLGDVESDPRVFDVIEHLNRAEGLITAADEVDRLCDLNHAAGRRAAASAAFEAAHDFYAQALALSSRVEGDAWSDHYERTHALHVEGARAAYLSGHVDVMDTLVEAAIGRARTVLDAVAAQEVHIASLVAAQRFGEAVSTALDVLTALGVDLPRDPTDADVEAAVTQTLTLLGARTSADIAAIGPIDDASIAAAHRIQNLVMSPAYLAVPRLLPVLAANIVRSSLEHGLAGGSPYGFAIFALVLCAGNVIDGAYRTGTIALELLDHVDDRAVQAKTMHVFYNLVKPFTDPVREMLDDQQRTFQIGVDTGDLEYAAWALHSIAANALYAGVVLPELAVTSQHYLQIIEHHPQLPAEACTAPFAQAVRNLMGHADDPARLVGDEYDETVVLPALREADFRGAAFIVTTLGTYVRYLFGRPDEALAFADEGGAYADGATATYHQVWWHQFRSLAILATAGDADAAVDAIGPSVEQLRTWASFSPVNHEHRVHLLDAEIARVRGRTGDALEAYDQAIATARHNGFLNDEALANELCGRFHLTRGSETAARAYLLEACYCYTRWGATAKTAQLTEQHRGLLQGFGSAGGASLVEPDGAVSMSMTHTGSTTDPSAGLDLASLFKAANLIASENRLDVLLNKVLDVAVENAGATRGFLVLDVDGVLVVGAARDADARDIAASGTPLSERTDVPASVISYVARTGDAVVITDARTDSRWSGTAGLDGAASTSILCAPIVHQDVTSGIVYLDNDLVAGAFTPARIQVLELLSRQAAISIENARYTEELRSHRDHLEELVRARTRELDAALHELKDANAVLDKLSLTDALTGLPNRRSFDQVIDVEWARAQRERQPFSLLMIDVDWFKRYNDEYGHQQGDDCLRRIAAALSSDLHRPTDVVARYGGEEFAAILPGVDAEGARHVGEAMVQSVRDLHLPHAASPRLGDVTISIGAATVVPDDNDPASLVKLADESLYRAKELGRDRYES